MDDQLMAMIATQKAQIARLSRKLAEANSRITALELTAASRLQRLQALTQGGLWSRMVATLRTNVHTPPVNKS